jgi:hypothetical protein
MRRVVVLLLAALMACAAVRPLLLGPPESTPSIRLLAWNLYLFVIPLGLGIFLLTGARWALMGAVIYGTVGLALDVSTIVQELTRGPGDPMTLVLSGLTGGLNFGLIIAAGRSFLRPGASGPPPESPPPNLPFRPSF